MHEQIRSELATGAELLGVPLSSAQLDTLVRYLALIDRWNRVYNLTAVRQVNDMVTLHLLDSLSVLPFITGQQVLDVGSGAGLPGIPLAVALPDKEFILLDSNGKKTRFMTQAAIDLGLGNVHVIQSRIEDYEGSFDHVLCRAFTDLDRFAAECARLLREEGTLLAMKGPEATETAGTSAHQRLHELKVPGLDATRMLVEVSV